MTRVVVTSSWDDVPHLSEDAKAGLAGVYMPHERAARMRGVPSLGAGAIYPVPEEEIICEPFVFPGWYRYVYALDVGWNRTAALWGALDPESDILYLWSEHYQGEAQPPIHAEAVKARGTWIPGVVDPAARGRSQKDGEALLTQYRLLGLMLTPADNAVESGIYNVWTRLSTGRLKVFRTLQNFLSEYRIYRRDHNGKVVKDSDHLMDCCRYLCTTGVALAAQRPPDQWAALMKPAATGKHEYAYDPLASAWGGAAGAQPGSATGAPRAGNPWMPHRIS